MKFTSKIAVVAVVAGPLLLGVTSASASTGTARTAPTAAKSTWGPWKNIPVAKPVFRTACGMHRIEIRDYIQHEKMRTRSISTKFGPAVAIQVYGRYVVKMIDHTASTSAIINASGSSLGDNYSIAYKDGAYLFRGTGASILENSRMEAGSSGLPHVAVTQGRVAVLYGDHHGHDTAHVVIAPDSVVDACTLLT